MSRGVRKPYERPEQRRSAPDGFWVHDKAPGFAQSPSAVNSKLLVTNLHYSVNEKDLAKIFGVIGTLAREPVIRYDRSGRSTGTAYVAYNTTAEATRAKQQLDGVSAKGEQMNVSYDPRGTSARTSKLIDRIAKPSLSERLNDPAIEISNGEGQGPGPVRSRTPRVRGRARGAVARRPNRSSPTPKTLEDLDKELEAFMGEGDNNNNVVTPAAPAEDATMA